MDVFVYAGYVQFLQSISSEIEPCSHGQTLSSVLKNKTIQKKRNSLVKYLLAGLLLVLKIKSFKPGHVLANITP